MSVPSPAVDPEPDEPSGTSRADRLATRPFIDLIVAQLWFGFGYATFVLLPKLLAADYHADARQVGFVMAAFGVLSLAASPAIGPIVSRLGNRRTMVAANLILLVSSLGFLFMSGANLFAAFLRGLQGVAWALSFGAGMALCAEIAPPSRLGQALGIFGAATLGMNAIAPVIAEPIAARLGARGVFVLAMVAAGIGAHRSRRLVGSSPRVANDNARPRRRDGRWDAVWTRMPAILALGTISLAGGAMFTFVAPFAISSGVADVRAFFVAYTVAALGARFGIARFVDRGGQGQAASTAGLIYGVAVAAMGGFGPGHLGTVAALFGVAHGVVYPALMAQLLATVHPMDRPRLLGWANGAMNLGVVALAPLGAAIQRIGYPVTFFTLGAATSLMAALLLAPVGRRLRRGLGWG